MADWALFLRKKVAVWSQKIQARTRRARHQLFSAGSRGLERLISMLSTGMFHQEPSNGIGFATKLALLYD